jgi:hypothetical protein
MPRDANNPEVRWSYVSAAEHHNQRGKQLAMFRTISAPKLAQCEWGEAITTSPHGAASSSDR